MSNELVIRVIDGREIGQRCNDGYMDATAMCKAAGKKWAAYARTQAAKDFEAALRSDVQNHTSELVQVRKGGTSDEQGTWVHPDIAVHLAQWCHPRFAVQVSRWVRELLSTGKVELHPAPPAAPAIPSSGDPLTDTLIAHQATLGAIIETRRRQVELERLQAATYRLAQNANRVAGAALAQSEANHGYYTVLGYSRLHGREMPVGLASMHGKKLADLCRSRGLRIGEMKDPRFGQVNTYPESLLAEYFGDPFGEIDAA